MRRLLAWLQRRIVVSDRDRPRPMHLYRGQDMLHRGPAEPEPEGGTGPVVVEDVPDGDACCYWCRRDPNRIDR